MAGFLTLLLSVCMCVCVSVNKLKYFKNIEPINFILVKTFPVTQGGNLSTLKKNRPGARVCVWGAKFGPNDKDRRNIFE